MCGLAGYVAYRDGARVPSEAALVATRDAMTARGPDGAGLWIAADARTGLAHRRLSLIDLSDAGHQPLFGRDGTLAIVFNGEIYNYAELQAELETEGRVFRGHSDTEVLLQLYDRDGDAMLDRLRGMYAIAIWDLTRRRLLLARDPYGIKPLYIADEGGVLRFASQVKALLADPGVSRAVDPAGLVGFHLMGSVPEPFTLYRAIRALPAGHKLVVEGGRVGEAVPFASVARRIAEAPQRSFDPAEVQAALADSVRAHLVADVEVGAFLSSGVDSGALLGLMRDAGGPPPTAMTLRFEEFEGRANDESPLAAEVARHYGARHHVRTVTRDEFAGDLDAILGAMDQPSIDGINSWFVSKATRELGLKVALSGLGGDELLAGYATFRTVPQLHRTAGPFARLPGLSGVARATLKALAPRLVESNPKMAGVLDHAGTMGGAYLLRRALLLPHELDAVLDRATVAEGLARLDIAGLIACALPGGGGASDNQRVSALESTIYMRNQLLRDSDWAGMAHSLEIRVPLVDYTLLGHVAPMMGAITPGAGKAALAGAPSRPLPDAIVNRPKTGFTIPVAAWLSGSGSGVIDRRDSRAWARRVADRFLNETTLTAAA